MNPSSQDDEGPITLPVRPAPQLQPLPEQQPLPEATQRVDEEGRRRFYRAQEPQEPWLKLPFEDRGSAIDKAVMTLPSPLRPAVDKILVARASGWRDAVEGTDCIFLMHRLDELESFGQKLAAAMFPSFGPENETPWYTKRNYLVVDCSDPGMISERLFGRAGYEGVLEGGVIANQLVLRPESVLIVANFEVADKSTTYKLINMIRDGRTTHMWCQGEYVDAVRTTHALLILATKRWYTRLQPIARHPVRCSEELLKRLIEGRPDVRWGEYSDVFDLHGTKYADTFPNYRTCVL